MPSTMKSRLSMFVILAAVAAAACGGTTGTVDTNSEDVLLDTTEGLLTEASSTTDPVPEAVVMDNEDTDAVAEAEDADGSEPGEPEDVGCGFRGVRRGGAKKFFDRNNDGKLDESERAELRDTLGNHGKRGAAFKMLRIGRPYLLKRIVWAYDADSDGMLSDTERQDLRDALQARCEKRKAEALAQFDANNDGQLDESEWRAARGERVKKGRERHAERRHKHGGKPGQPMGQDEREARRKEMRDFYKGKRDEVMAKFDADKNGKLEGDEVTALKAAIRARFEGETPSE
jgi:hypothetical protein